MTLRITYLIGTDPGILAVLDYTEGEVQSLVERLAAGGLSVSTQSLVLKLVSTIEEVSLHGEHGFRFQSIEWLPEGDAPEPSPSTQLLRAAIAARHALRSYQHGNASTELAAEIADELDTAIRHALDHHDSELRNFSKTLSELQVAIEDIRLKCE